MTASVAFTMLSFIVTLMSKPFAQRTQTFNVSVTAIGIASGFLLLLGKPIGVKCAMLISYVAVFAIAQLFIRSKTHTTVESAS